MPNIFSYNFMLHAFVAGIIIACVAPLIGMFLVVRRNALMADTLAHVSLFGVAVGLITGTSPLLAALAASLLASLGMERLQRVRRISGESVLALFLSGSLALAVVAVGMVKGLSMNFTSFLFGSITTVRASDLYVIGFLGLAAAIIIVMLYRGLFLAALDEELAQTSGINVKLLNSVLIITTGVIVTLSMRIVGALLVGALMVIPALSAAQYGRGFRTTMILSVFASLTSVVIGLFASYYLDLVSGGTIVLIALLIFIISLFLNRRKSLVKKQTAAP